MSSLAFLHIKAADSLIMDWHSYIGIWLPKIQDQKLLMLDWHSFPGWGNKHIALLFTYKDGKYFLFGKMWLCTTLIADRVRIKIIDTPLTLTLMSYWQSLASQQLHAKCIRSLVTATISFLCIIINLQNLRGLPVSERPQYPLSVRGMK